MTVRDSVTVIDGEISLDEKGRSRRLFSVDDVGEIIVVRFASALYHGEEPFFVLATRDELLVLPTLTQGARNLLLLLLRRDHGGLSLHEAECEKLPLGWRRRIFGVLPLFPIPQLMVRQRASHVPWRVLRSLSERQIESILGASYGG